MNTETHEGFVLCIEDRDCDDLERGQVYQKMADRRAAEDGYIRIVDESGEDYLYPESYFVPIQVPRTARKALLAKS
jgi:hypothetical protein